MTTLFETCSVPWLVLVLLLHCAWAGVVVYKESTHGEVAEIASAPSKFGAYVPSHGLWGVIVYSSPSSACSQVDGPPVNVDHHGNWILLAESGNCSFDNKVRNAQNAGYHAAIVHNVNSSVLEPMGPDNVPDIVIPSVFIGSDDADMIRRHYLYNSTYFVVIHDLPFDITLRMFVIFAIVAGVYFMVSIAICAVRHMINRKFAPKSSITEFPIHNYSEDDAFSKCVICMEDFVENDEMRILTCNHGFHAVCIDGWLTKRHNECPICRRVVISRRSSISSSSDDSDLRPLLSHAGPSAAQQRNPSQRSRSSSSSEGSFHSIEGNTSRPATDLLWTIADFVTQAVWDNPTDNNHDHPSDPEPSGSGHHEPSDPEPSGSGHHEPSDPEPSGSGHHEPSDPEPSGSGHHEPSDPEPSGSGHHEPSDHEPSSSGHHEPSDYQPYGSGHHEPSDYDYGHHHQSDDFAHSLWDTPSINDSDHWTYD